MRRVLFFIITATICIFSHSCVSVDFVNLDIRYPAHVTFEPGTRKIIIVDNSFKLKAEADSSGIVPPSIILRNFIIDSIRPVLLNNIAQFMNEEKLFDTVEVYPYYPRPLYEYYENDSLYELPLAKEDIQNICYNTEADALISLDFIDISIRDVDNLFYLTESGFIFRCYSALGDILASPIIDIDSFRVRKDLVSIPMLSKFLILENPPLIADRFVDSLIPKWETQERILFNDYPDNASETSKLIQVGRWNGAFILWEEAFNKTNNKKKKIKYASNMALACEYMDNIEQAQKWINTANDLLSKKDNGELAKYIRDYKKIIDKRAKNAPILKKQLNINTEENLR